MLRYNHDQQRLETLSGEDACEALAVIAAGFSLNAAFTLDTAYQVELAVNKAREGEEDAG